MMSEGKDVQIDRSHARNMIVVRTVTVGFSMPLALGSNDELDDLVGRAANVAKRIRDVLEQSLGLTVQTIRLMTNPFADWWNPDHDKTPVEKLVLLLKKNGIEYCSIGPARTSKQIKRVPELLAISPVLNCSASLDEASDAANLIADVYKELAERDRRDNFRFCALANCSGGIPFFPSGFLPSGEPMSVYLGLETGQLYRELLEMDPSMKELARVCTEEFGTIQTVVEKECAALKVEYGGIDTSLCPGLGEESSAAACVNAVLGEDVPFGARGSLAIASRLTRALQTKIGVKTTGFCGLMLPVMEDVVLSKAVNDNLVGVGDLLTLSSVCGIGLDTIPLSGKTTKVRIMATLQDLHELAHRLRKPLTARLFPVPGVDVGDLVDTGDPRLCPCVAMDIDK